MSELISKKAIGGHVYPDVLSEAEWRAGNEAMYYLKKVINLYENPSDMRRYSVSPEEYARMEAIVDVAAAALKRGLAIYVIPQEEIGEEHHDLPVQHGHPSGL